MKKIVSFIVLFLFSVSQVIACGPGHLYYSEDICSEYSYTGGTLNEDGYFDKDLQAYLEIVGEILSKKIDLTQKEDYELFLELEQKVKDYISLDKYRGKSRTMICAIHIKLDAIKTNTSLWLYKNNPGDGDIVLVEEGEDLMEYKNFRLILKI